VGDTQRVGDRVPQRLERIFVHRAASPLDHHDDRPVEAGAEGLLQEVIRATRRVGLLRGCPRR
jgi:hypothetical protein